MDFLSFGDSIIPLHLEWKINAIPTGSKIFIFTLHFHPKQGKTVVFVSNQRSLQLACLTHPSHPSLHTAPTEAKVDQLLVNKKGL